MPSPKDTKGPVVKSGPTRGENRSRNKDGQWRKKRNDSGKNRDKKKDSGCFLSTAACTYRGLPDDCTELQALRQFRDEVLLSSPAGEKLVADYYELAPAIVARLENRADYDLIWQTMQRCLLFIELAEYDRAVKAYRTMIEVLVQRLEK